ncbi:MAG TPA: metal-dependent hydrolase [Thermoanaerobaculia bacterium]
MPTILSHPATALLKTWFRDVPPRVVTFGALAAILPDADVAAFAVGIPYGHPLGHRGFTHSIVFAVLVAALATLLLRPPKRLPAFTFLFLCTMSHAVFDALTNGGLGVAFFSPFDNRRYFFPWQPIEVSPIGAAFFSRRGMSVLLSEVLWVWTPLIVVGVAGWLVRRPKAKAR